MPTIMKWVSISALLLEAMSWRAAVNYHWLDFVVCMGAIVVIMQAVQGKQYLWAAGFLVIAVLFNPVVLVVRLSGGLSLLLVLACLPPFAISLAALKKQPVFSIPSITGRNPGSLSL